jgi:hypothetical protein
MKLSKMKSQLAQLGYMSSKSRSTALLRDTEEIKLFTSAKDIPV